MNELVSLKGNDVFTDSLRVADGTGNKHRSVQRIIDKHISSIEQFGRVRFEITPLDTKGGIQDVKIYLLNEQQSTFLITLLKNTDVVVKFKIELVKQFYEMRKFIIERQSKEWFETRQQSKSTRMTESDTIKRFIEYASTQGSEHADNYYRLFSTLANKSVGVSKRDEATIVQLNNLTLIENIILHTIDDGINAGLPYKKIYEDCKRKLELFKSLLYLEHSA